MCDHIVHTANHGNRLTGLFSMPQPTAGLAERVPAHIADRERVIRVGKDPRTAAGTGAVDHTRCSVTDELIQQPFISVPGGAGLHEVLCIRHYIVLDKHV